MTIGSADHSIHTRKKKCPFNSVHWQFILLGVIAMAIMIVCGACIYVDRIDRSFLKDHPELQR